MKLKELLAKLYKESADTLSLAYRIVKQCTIRDGEKIVYKGSIELLPFHTLMEYGDRIVDKKGSNDIWLEVTR